MQKKVTDSKRHQLKLRFWHYLVIFVLLTLAASAIFKVITPKAKTVAVKNETITSNYDKTKSTFKKIFFSGNKIAAPDIFNVFSLILSNSSADLLANQIINKNNLVVHETIPNYWSSENAELIKSTYESNYTFVNIINQQENDLKIIQDEAIKTCLNFYSKHNVNLKLVPQTGSIVYLSKGTEQSKVEAKDAYSMQIPLTYELDGYPVYYQNEKDYPFFCKIDNNYNIRKVVFKDFFSNFEIIDQMSPISIDQAINNIKNGTASIISAESQVAYIVDLNWINEADLYSVEIDYRYDDVLKIVYPFYKFKAKLTNSAGINIQAEIITPAIATAKDK